MYYFAYELFSRGYLYISEPNDSQKTFKFYLFCNGLSSRIGKLTDLQILDLVKETGCVRGNGMQMTTHLLIHAFVYSRCVY